MTCPACQQLNPDGARFCLGCGGALAAAGAVVPADPQRAALERALGAQYEVDRLLGRGGMGAVYLAREKALERAVAIKVLPPETATDADTRERFRREARTAAKLTHPNIVPLHTFGDVEGMLYFVMGYVKGESLAERMRREGKLPEEDVRRILAEVADALHYAHKQGVVHRDIKPDNILIDDESGRPMLTDFGVAKARASGATLTEAGAIVGTPYYMSPEQASGARDIDGRSDLYSLGVMGYQMLAGRLPFEGESFQDVIVQHVTKEPAPLAALVPEAPADLTAAVMRCLVKAPADRWLDGGSLRLALGDGVLDEDDLPVRLRALSATLGHSLIPAAGTVVAAAAAFALHDTVWGRPLAAGAVGGVVLPSMAVWWMTLAARKAGFSTAQIRSVAFWAPKRWTFWWPRRWRRQGDLWDRLPPILRRERHLRVAALTAACLLVPTILFIQGLGPHNPHLILRALGAALLLGSLCAVPLAIGAAVVAEWWVRRSGLDGYDARLALKQPSHDAAFWRKPRFAAFLLPPPGRAVAARPAEPRSPDEYAAAIRDLVGQLPSGTQATVSEAADAARQLLGTVAALDAEIANLARDADPQELEAVEVKLRALGPEAPDEGDVRRRKRALLVPQRDLLRQLDQRLAEVTARRARLLDLMRTMWLQVATLRAEAAHDTLAVTEISGRVKALCSEIDAHVQAAATVRLETG